MKFRTLVAASAAILAATAPAFAGGGNKSETSAGRPMAKSDIVDTAISAGSFTTLVAAVQAAGLEETLRGPGPFTVFAPTDAAFAALPAGTVESLLKPENKDQLVGILTYHVVSGKTKSKALIGKTLDVATVNGAKLSIDGTDGVKVNGVAVSKADIYASNGVIHVVDSVLLPAASN